MKTLLQHCLRLRKERAYRYAQKQILLEGEKIIREAAEFLPIRFLLTSQKHSNIKAENLVEVSHSAIEKISSCPNPEGLLAIVDMPTYHDLSHCSPLLVLDRVSDPGNLGTLLRTALALGWKGVYLIDGCCDPYNDKALRAAKGATLRLPMEWGSLETLKERLPRYQALAAHLNGLRVEELHPQIKPLLLVLGSESHGLERDLLSLCQPVTLPIEGIDSLNVSIAGAILMYLLHQKL